jgi:hypothetical protein
VTFVHNGRTSPIVPPVQPSPTDLRAARRRRELNLAILDVSEERGLARTLEIACECGHPQCWETLAIEAEAFSALVAAGDPALAPRHPLPATPVAAEAPAPVAVS